MSWSKNIYKYCVPILYYSFIVLLLTLVLFSILMLFLTDSSEGTIIWLCVMFSSFMFLLIFGNFFLLFTFQSHDDNNQERQSWKCFGQTCNRSLVVFLSQFFVILLILACCIERITLAETCEETTVWIAILLSTVGYILPSPKL